MRSGIGCDPVGDVGEEVALFEIEVMAVDFHMHLPFTVWMNLDISIPQLRQLCK